MHFHGSYEPNDVSFLLNIEDFKEISILEKEALIQSGEKHYSEVLTEEMDFSDEYLSLFHTIFDENIQRISTDVVALSKHIAQLHNPVIVSLARAGTPYGVLIKRCLADCFMVNTNHYSVSIIRDKGIDTVAMDYMVNKHGVDATYIFVDGWTGKGAIYNQLALSMKNYKHNLQHRFVVLSDIAGVADIAATREDYIIPSCLINSTISGLISRTLINSNPDSFHRAKFYEKYKQKDLSLAYVNKIHNHILKNELHKQTQTIVEFNETYKNNYQDFINQMIDKYKVSTRNYIKPGLGETTRMLIRRNPDFILINEKYASLLEHVLLLCKIKNVKIYIENNMPIPCVGIINKIQS
jgi:hypothetical protein